MTGIVKRILKDKKGFAAPTFALSAVPLIGFLGLAMDVGTAYRNQAEIQSALESTALMLARRSVFNPEMSESELISDGKGIIAARVKADLDYQEFKVDTDAVEVKIAATAEVPTTFSLFFGKKEFEVSGKARAAFERRIVEVAVALDVTNSMKANMNGVTRLEGAKQAMHALADAAASGVANQQNAGVKIGFVPFDGQVRVFDEATADNIFDNKLHDKQIDWANEADIADDHLPEFDYKPGGNNGKGHGSTKTEKMTRWDVFDSLRGYNADYKWGGCFEARTGDYTFSIANPLRNDPNTKYVPYFAPDQPDNVRGWNSYVPDEGPLCPTGSVDGSSDHWDIVNNACKYMGQGNGSKALTAAPTFRAFGKSNPNGFCTDNPPILPLTSNINTFKDRIDEIVDTSSSWGVTDINPGFYWAWNVVTNSWPFNQAKRPNKSRKFIVMLSDGANWMRNNRKNNYSYFGYPEDGRIEEATGMPQTDVSNTRDAIDEATERMCDAIKADNNDIEVYYVYYNNNLTSTPARIGKHCATSDAHFIHASSTDQLISTFKSIGENLGKLRLAKAE